MAERPRLKLIKNSIAGLMLTIGAGLVAYVGYDIQNIRDEQDQISRKLDQENPEFTSTELNNLLEELDSMEGRIDRDKILVVSGLSAVTAGAGTLAVRVKGDSIY